MPSYFTVTLIQVLVGVLFFISLLYGQRDLTVLSLLVLAVVGGTRLWARNSLSRVQFGFAADKSRLFPGERAILTISAQNGKLLPIWLAILVPIEGLTQRAPSKQVLTRSSSLLWFQRMQFKWDFAADKRGVYRIGPLDIVAADLFSFFPKHKRAEESHTIVVYPRLVPLKATALPRRDFFGTPRAKSPVQDPIYILGTRDYEPGHPSKYIHWKASARHNHLQEKVFEATLRDKVLLAVDVASFLSKEAEDEFERTLEVAAAMAARLDRQGHSVGFVSDGTVQGGGLATIPVAKNYEQLPAILEMLARLEWNLAGDLRDLLRRKLALTWGISCVYFSHADDETAAHAAELFSEYRTPAVFYVCRRGSSEATNGIKTRGNVYLMDDIREIQAPST